MEPTRQSTRNEAPYEGVLNSVGHALYGKKNWERMITPPTELVKTKPERVFQAVGYVFLLELVLAVMCLIGYGLYVLIS